MRSCFFMLVLFFAPWVCTGCAAASAPDASVSDTSVLSTQGSAGRRTPHENKPAMAEKITRASAQVSAAGAIIAGSEKGTALQKTEKGFRLLRDGKPYFVRGAGIHLSLPMRDFKAAGGNSIRTWGAEQIGQALTLAQENGLTVSAGIWLGQPRQGFRYSDAEAVAKQKERVLEAVRQHKDHPALLVWGIGNEAEGEGNDPAVFKAFNDIAREVKKIDPNHPTMTVFAEITPMKIDNFNRYCPDIDILGINSYGGLPSVQERASKLGLTKPFLVTEWGALGPWESGKSDWGAPFEMNSSERAEFAMKGYTATIENNPQCLGSYVFLWGHKQERTGTWFGLVLESGEKTALIDEITNHWTGKYPSNRAPRLVKLESTAANAKVEAGEQFVARVVAEDAEKNPLAYTWEVRQETSDARTGGDKENVPPTHPEAVVKADGASFTFRAPERSGDYRVFVIVRDGKGGAATANFPFYVR